MILEGIVTTLSEEGAINISPMGPRVDESFSQLILRPYQTSTTYRNLKRHGEGIFHITDDVELLAHAAVGNPDPVPPLLPATTVRGSILRDACRWYAFRVTSLDDRSERTEIVCHVVDSGVYRQFFGFNRGKHAVLEAAILATRTAFLPAEEIRREYRKLQILVDKTGGPAEHRAFHFLEKYVEQRFAELHNAGNTMPDLNR